MKYSLVQNTEDKYANIMLMCLHPTDLLTSNLQLCCTYAKIVVNLWILYVLKLSCPKLIFEPFLYFTYKHVEALPQKQLKHEHTPANHISRFKQITWRNKGID